MTLLRLTLAFSLLCTSAGLAQDSALVPGDNLVVEGIPRVPASLAEAVSRYTEFRRAAFLSWHPTRREMLIRTRFAETVQVHQVRSPGGARTQLTFFSDPVRGAVYPPKDARWFIFSKDTGGDEFYQAKRKGHGPLHQQAGRPQHRPAPGPGGQQRVAGP